MFEIRFPASTLACLFCLTVVLNAAGDDPLPSGATSAASQPSTRAMTERGSTIRFARSDDGLGFAIDERLQFDDAACPGIALLADGRLLLVHERSGAAGDSAIAALACALSEDQGRTWSKPTPVELMGLPARYRRVGAPRLVTSARGDALMLLNAVDRRDRPALLLARWKKDATFDVRGPLRFEQRDLTLGAASLTRLGNDLHLFARQTAPAAIPIHGLLAENGRVSSLSVAGRELLTAGGTIVSLETGYRWYGPGAEGIVSAVSRDGVSWSLEGGVRLPAVAEAAAVRLKDGATLIAFTPQSGRMRLRGEHDRQRNRNNSGEPVVRTNDGGPSQADARGDADEGHDLDTTASADGREPGVATEDAAGAVTDDAVAAAGQAEAVQDATGQQEPNDAMVEAAGAEGDSNDLWLGVEEWPPPAGIDSPDAASPVFSDVADVPLPDFHRYINYMEWFKQSRETQTPWPNAWDFYDRFIPNPSDRPGDKPPLPTFVNMFTDAGFLADPAPWNPLERPEWEASFTAAADLKTAFAEASRIEGYVRPLLFPPPAEFADASPVIDRDELEARNLMMNIMLPDLGAHRRVVQQTLADAWRAPDGRPDADTMLDAFRTSLGSANHLDTGVFLIDKLVSISERHMVESSARWALAHDVFNAEQMEQALEILSTHDAPAGDPMNWIRGELACSMDLTQYVYGPVEPGREPKLNPKRFERIFKGISDPEKVPKLTEEQIAQSDARATQEAFENYYREFVDLTRRGYAATKSSDLDRLAESYVQRDPVLHELVPVLSRVYSNITRHEASRRATQLTYAIHLHKARTGRWPQSLDELPPRHAAQARIDPFTDCDFGYQLTESGPVLYSLSENGADDAAVHHDRWGDGAAAGESDDHVFWPPQRRAR